MKGKFMKYHISDKEYDMIQKDMQRRTETVCCSSPKSKNKNPAIHFFCMYAFEIMLYVFADILGVIAQPQEQAVAIVALLTVPLLFTDKPFRMIYGIGVGVVLFILTAIEVKDKSVLLLTLLML